MLKTQEYPLNKFSKNYQVHNLNHHFHESIFGYKIICWYNNLLSK